MKNIELKERFTDERTGIEYIRKGDYYLPNLIDTASVKANELGKYGRLRLKYLLEHKKAEYTCLWAENKLREHLKEIDETANKRLNLLIKKLVIIEDVNEELKIKDQLEWVKRMNSIKNRVEELILKELIYV